MRPTDSDLLRLIGLVYETTENPAGWSEFLAQYAEALGAQVTFFQLHRFTARRSEILQSYGLASPLHASYNAHYARLNVWRNAGARQYAEGRVLLDPEVVPRQALVRTEFYNDCLLRFGAVYSVAGVITRTSDEAFVLTAMNGPRHRAWDESHKRAIEVLLPHVRRAHALQERVQVSRADQAVLNALDVGVVFVTRDQMLVACNRPAETILERQDGFALRNGAFHAIDSVADAQLRHVVLQAVSANASLECPAAVSVERASLRRAYQVLVAPLRNGSPMFAALRSPEAVLLIIDPESRRTPADDVLISLYGLTRREAALASALSRGRTIEHAADELGMTYETARSHLRRIFDKTNTSRQAELVMLLTRLSSVAHSTA